MTKSPENHIIPEHAECVFKWVRNTIYQWDQEMYDGSIARFERNRFIDGAFVLPILPNGNILLTKQVQPTRNPFISLPWWAFDHPDEDPILCAKRELKEETGYVSDEWKEWFRFDGSPNTIMYVHYFIAHNCKKVSEISLDPGEKIETFEVNFDEFLELSSNPKFHHHWNLLPLLYEARLDEQKYKALKDFVYNNKL